MLRILVLNGGMNIAQMNLNRRNFYSFNSIPYGHTRMCVSTSIYNNILILPFRIMNCINQCPFMITLQRLQIGTISSICAGDNASHADGRPGSRNIRH